MNADTTSVLVPLSSLAESDRGLLLRIVTIVKGIVLDLCVKVLLAEQGCMGSLYEKSPEAAP